MNQKDLEFELSMRRYQIALANQVYGIVLISDSGRVEFVNQSFCNMLNLSLSPSELVGQTSSEFLKLILPAYSNPEEALLRIKEILSQKSQYVGEEIVMLDGRVFLADFTPILIGETLSGQMWQHRDITERKRVEEEKEELTKNLRERVKELNCLYSISSITEIPDSSMVQQFKKIVNVLPPAWQYSEITCAKITIENDEYKTDNYIETKWKQSSDIMVHGTKAGCVEVCYLEEKAEIDEGPFLEQERRLILAIAQQLGRIIERMKAEETLKNAEHRLRMLMDKLPAGVIAADMETRRFVFANKTICQILGYSQKELLELNIADIHPAENLPHVKAEFEKAMKSGSIHAADLPVRRKDGTVFPADIHNLFLELEGRNCLLGIFSDISERKQIERVLLLRLKLWEFIATYSLNELMQLALDEIGEITGSPIGFYHFVETDQKTLSLQAWSSRTLQEFCKAEGSGMHYSIDNAGVWTDCVRERKPVIHNDYASLPHRKGLPPGHAAIVRELVVPILRAGSVVSILGVGNKPTDYGEKDVELVRYVADITWEILAHKKMEEALQENEKKFRELSIIDNLTRLYNSRHFYNQLKSEIDRVNRYNEPITLILFDVDDFKAFNDTYGHIEGDQVLTRLGQVIKKCLRKTDTAYRYGGEEFIILLPMTISKDGVATAERIRAEFKKENFSPIPGKEVHMTLSVGVGQYRPNEEMKVFVHRVDQLMYQAKKSGKDRVCYDEKFGFF